MNIQNATRLYEKWMASQMPSVFQNDLQQKHANMAASPFLFMRATYYRWVQRFPVVCKDLARMHNVLSVGDLHVENYGLWPDAEGRVIWGVNDVDEAYPLPWTNDPVRLATSALLAAEGGHLSITFKDACDAILAGYYNGLEKGARPFVLAAKHTKLRQMAFSRMRDPRLFWQKAKRFPEITDVPRGALTALERALPVGVESYSVRTRQAGEGSLGRPRYIALADWRGGLVARECKALLPSASAWAAGVNDPVNYYGQMISLPSRCPDPFLHVDGSWIVRRIGPNCSRIVLTQLAAAQDQWVLLKSMGREAATIDAGEKVERKRIGSELEKLPSSWLRKAAAAMADDVRQDFDFWRSTFQGMKS